ncbi:class I SAM-dependent methyltransferase [Niabella insulamsoli]|uniref:class I SAM-dependent methyltransferase n=1 Tax=Niabella insulamsoli TaxID=3144874 RepID=UPI0031FC3B9E
MTTFDRKKHWEHIYQTKELAEVSWYQAVPEPSLNFLAQLSLPLNASIIDIGGGDSFFVDHLLDKGFKNVTVLNISEAAIAKAKKRLGDKSKQVTLIVTDIANFQPTEKYDFWHDRAAFHFLTEEAEILRYIETAKQSITTDGALVIGTFSQQGPEKCSGIAIQRYSEAAMTRRFQTFFDKINCVAVEHHTPLNTLQHFIFCCFKKAKKL